jgi:hypothetical protein
LEIDEKIDAEPLSEAFSFTREKKKAMHGLKGILAGIVADKRLNELEFLFLDSWLQSQQYLADDKDVRDILQRVGDILEDGQVSRDELALMQAHIERVASERMSADTDTVASMDELIGFITGVASDGVLNDDEIVALSDWLLQNSAIQKVWPATIIADRLETILNDGTIYEKERANLLAAINKITGEGAAHFESSTDMWEDDTDSLSFAGKTFCLTGEFVSGDRDSIDTMLKMLGAKTSTAVQRGVDYLVIGTLSSHDWLYTSHGRKIEKALLLKREGCKVTVITERTLLKFSRKLTQASF